jgi:DNA-binding transcriptional regulator YdaS (Cro superfamily)
MSDWIQALRVECERTSQGHAAALIGYSPAVVNQVLKGSYRGDLRRVEDAVRGALLGATVDCPVIGEIPRHRCIDHQRRAGTFAATNPLRVTLSLTCPDCPNRGRPAA